MTTERVQIQATRLADQVYELLRARILTGELLPGARLTVPGLSAELGLSRSPVREAVQRLVQEGLCVDRPHAGAVVATVDLHALVEAYEVRAVLERLSVTRATLRASPVELAELRTLDQAHRKAVALGVPHEVARADTALHRRIMALAGNGQLELALGPILDRMSLAIMAGDVQQWPTLAIQEHDRVLEAMEAGDGERAGELMAEHVLLVRARLRSKAQGMEDEVVDEEE